ncbi:hypothetical protein NHX12_006303, partial [Muraenolepis orangiensis]
LQPGFVQAWCGSGQSPQSGGSCQQEGWAGSRACPLGPGGTAANDFFQMSLTKEISHCGWFTLTEIAREAEEGRYTACEEPRGAVQGMQGCSIQKAASVRSHYLSGGASLGMRGPHSAALLPHCSYKIALSLM